MQIIGKAPVVIPAVTAKTFDQYWMQSFTIYAPAPNAKVTANFTLVPMMSSTGELYQDHAVSGSIPDLLALISSTPSFLTVHDGLLSAVQALAQGQNLI